MVQNRKSRGHLYGPWLPVVHWWKVAALCSYFLGQNGAFLKSLMYDSLFSRGELTQSHHVQHKTVCAFCQMLPPSCRFSPSFLTYFLHTELASPLRSADCHLSQCSTWHVLSMRTRELVRKRRVRLYAHGGKRRLLSSCLWNGGHHVSAPVCGCEH